MKTADLDPKDGGMGFTERCTGCTAIILGKTRTGHSDACRPRVIEKVGQASSSGAERVKGARARGKEFLARRMEKNFAKEVAVGRRRIEGGAQDPTGDTRA